MSHITLAQQGLAAAEAKDWNRALTKLSMALEFSVNPAWLIARSKALINLSRYDEALDDANLAWHTAYDRNKRGLMIEAHYRRAVAYFRLGKLADADACCIYSMRLIKGAPAVEKEDPVAHLKDPETGRWTATSEDAVHEAKNDDVNKVNNGVEGIVLAREGKGVTHVKEWRLASTLRMQILSMMDKLPADDPARVATAPAKPERKELADVTSSTAEKEKPESVGGSTVPETAASQPERKELAGVASSTAEKEKPESVGGSTVPETAASQPAIPRDTSLRLQEFQNNTNMSASIFSKNVNKERLRVTFQPTSVHLDGIVYPGGDEKEFRLDLWGEIDTTASKYTVTPNKVELSLVKKTPGKWAQLKSEGKQPAAAPAPATAAAVVKPAAESAPPAASATTEKPAAAAESKPSTGAPSYPSSSRTGPKDWDNLDVGGDDEEDDGVDVNHFFKKLYKNATPEQQRAMMKSFTESNGTSLSTDWNDVKNKTVETVPPEGVQAKKWN